MLRLVDEMNRECFVNTFLAVAVSRVSCVAGRVEHNYANLVSE